MRGVAPHPNYPAEEGRYLRGDDYSPVAVAIILTRRPDDIPPELEQLVRTALHAGAALSGTVQTENIGIEKIVSNIVANSNIRYLIVGGPESEGHLTGEALKALLLNGVDKEKRIIGTEAPNPVLLNVPGTYIERFLKQISLIDLQFEGAPGIISKAVWSCRQKEPVEFRGHSLYNPGPYPEPPLSGTVVWRITQPWAEPADDKEREAVRRAKELMEILKARSRKDRNLQ